MAEFGVGTEVIIGLPYVPNAGCPQAGELITSVRDQIPDPVYTDDGTALPDTDGSFLRAQSLYRWLTNGIRELTRRSNWVVLDWTALPQAHSQHVYSLDRRFINVDGVFVNQYRLLHLDELHTIYPSQAIAQPLWFSWHHRSDHLELSMYPAPDRVEPVANLMTTIDPLAGEIPVSSVAGFLPFGYVQIGDEILLYNQLVTPPVPVPPALPGNPSIRVVKRGMCGTHAGFHYAGTSVIHLSIWCRGMRVPSAVTRSTDCVELPLAFLAPLETYLLSQVKRAEQDMGSAQGLMQEFVAMTNDILNDPGWQQPPFPMQARAYGEYAGGSGLFYGRVVVP